jgi:four helix bundle protein
MIADCRLKIADFIGGGPMDPEEMKRRTKEFSKRVIGLCRELPTTREGRLTGEQLFRAGTSVGANYRAACRARSRADFIAKLGVVLEEADEALYWLEILGEVGHSSLKSSICNRLPPRFFKLSLHRLSDSPGRQSRSPEILLLNMNTVTMLGALIKGGVACAPRS